MADWFEHDYEYNTLTLTSIKPGVRFEYEEAMSLLEELEERVSDMEQRAQQLEDEARKDYADTETYLTRLWYE